MVERRTPFTTATLYGHTYYFNSVNSMPVPTDSTFHSFQQSSKFSDSAFIKMASGSSKAAKKLIRIDVSFDSVCDWCFLGKRNLEKAIASSSDKYTFEVKWHPYFLLPTAPKEGVPKNELMMKLVGPRGIQMQARMSELFKSYGMPHDTTGLTGNTMDSHRLVYFAGKQGLDRQNELIEELFVGYFTQGKYIGDREFLVESAKKAGVEGAAEFLENPNNGVKEVNEEIKKYSGHINGVPYYVINGKHSLNGCQPAETFLSAFEAAAK
ncbi:uncharacterized protein LOC127240218 [Andrographis paniculata]|uniref:uncharacterized protein LOC127240218 n=1 Tax=Andrographis paniculata TaxID=175694 RepID=UPI0021E783E5|nr:uncharacterized protein LOC127240218 [Andrographis paniculata]